MGRGGGGGGGGGLPPLLGSNLVDKNEGERKGQREIEEQIRQKKKRRGRGKERKIKGIFFQRSDGRISRWSKN